VFSSFMEKEVKVEVEKEVRRKGGGSEVEVRRK